MQTSGFFTFARERHRIFEARADGHPRPWTKDPILDRYRFTNVFRELDATTLWFAKNVRDPMRDRPEVLLATVLFRWFNRISTGEAIFTQNMLDLGISPSFGTDGISPWEMREIRSVSTDEWLDYVRSAIRQYCGAGPYVTGAYIIKTPDGYDKLSGVLKCVEWFMTQTPIVSGPLACVPHESDRYGWWQVASDMIRAREYEASLRPTLESTWEWLRKFPFLGDFMAYEIVTDLRHTALLDKAPDIMTWANPGPGAMRGLNRINGRDLNKRLPKHVFVCEMRTILEESRYQERWPSVFPAWEMREVEHTLCEFDKYERARLGEGRPRGVYK